MKYLKFLMLLLSLSLMSFVSISSQKDPIVKANTKSMITWKSDLINVGSIPNGIPKLIVYEFKNNSKKSVTITNVKGSCGCTATDYTKTPIASGKKGYVKATYNAANNGAFTKTVTVTTTADKTPVVLTFKGTVVEKS